MCKRPMANQAMAERKRNASSRPIEKHSDFEVHSQTAELLLPDLNLCAKEAAKRPKTGHRDLIYCANRSRNPLIYMTQLFSFIRPDRVLSNRIFQSYDDILDHACAAWRRIVDQPWRIVTIGLRDWAHGF